MRFNIDYLMLFVLFMVLPFFDAANGILVINGLIEEGGVASPSQFGRAMLLGLLVYMVYRARLSVVPFYFLLFLLSVELVYGLLHGQVFGVILGIITTQKLIYLFLVSIVIENILSKSQSSQKDVYNLFQVNLLILSICLIFSTITSVGNSTYGWGFGTKSFFSSGNGLGLYLGIGTLVLIGIKRYFYPKISLMILFVCSVSVALIGSKTALLFCMINLTLLLWITKYRSIVFVIFIVISPFFIASVVDFLFVLFDVIAARFDNSDSLLYYLGSGRIEYVLSAFDVFWENDGNIIRLLFGSGAFVSFQSIEHVVLFDTLEADLFDLIFMYGLVSAIIYLSLSFFILYKLKGKPILIVAFLLLMGHSVIAGHVLFNGMSSICFAIFYALSSNVRRL
ncbi:hypothetical protein [Vibrio splendidus]|uniref:hypothetical protein n=1 Tax=Vibrio splendidus TaxID=29497 RepID=UPI0026E28A46|nr:hypothetical protein [Vibrio splendidus]MDO6531109.1 hypothetical protein [Vibrio splendidus]